MRIQSSRRFVKDLEGLTKRDDYLRRRVIKTIQLLRENPQHPSLRLHKLFGLETYSVSVTMKIRLIYRVLSGEVLLLRIGTHDEVY